MTSKRFKYDVFISYSSKDREWVRGELLPAIEKMGFKVCIDFRDFEPGAPSLNEMERAVVQSKKSLLVLSSAYLQSEWAEIENLMIQTLSPANRQRRLIPLLKQKCELPLRIGSLTYINFVDPEDLEIEWGKLYTALGKVSNTVKVTRTSEDKKPPPRKKKAILLLRGEFSDFNTTRRDVLISSIAAILQIRKDEIEFDRAYPGSIVVELFFPEHIVSFLLGLAEKNDQRLANLDIYRLKVDDSDYIDLIPSVGQLPTGSRIPYVHNGVFTGRVDDLLVLAQNLFHEAKNMLVTQTTALTGLGGIGKTQLAAEFCYRYGRYFRGVHWINAEQSIESEIAACGISMGLPSFINTTSEQIRKTLQLWQEQPDRLIILDNVEGPGTLREWLPQLHGLHILITSRNQNWSADLDIAVHQLNVFSHADSLVLLRKLAPRLMNIPDNELLRVTNRLGDLPLALDLAGRYFSGKPTLTPIEYLKRLEDAGNILKHTSMSSWVKGESPTAHETSLLETFLVSWEQLDESETDKLCKVLFIASGHLAPSIPIPREIFYGLANDDKDKADIALLRLQDIGLLDLSLVIHPLLAEFARLQLTDSKEGLSEIIESVDVACVKAYKEEVPSAFIPLRPHIEKLAPTIESYFIDKAPRIWNILAYQYHMNAELEKSKMAYERAIEIGEEIFGENSSMLIPWMSNLATVLADIGSLAEADEMLERAIRMGMKNADIEPLGTINILNNLGAVAREMGNYQYAKELYEFALKMCGEKLGEDHALFATIINNMGITLRDEGNLNEARQMFERALELSEKTFGESHPNVAIRLSNLALILSKLGDLTGAKQMYERALEITEKNFGKDHPKVATIMNNLGLLLEDLGDFEGGHKLLDHALEIDQKIYGNDHVDVARDMVNLGTILKSIHDLDGARKMFERALEISEMILGSEHPTVAKMINNLAGVLSDSGELKEAYSLYERALAIDEKAFGSESPNNATQLSNLGSVLMKMGDLNSARRMYERALEIDEKSLGKDQLGAAITLNNLAVVSFELRDWQKAYDYMRRVIEIREKYLPADHPSLQRSRTDLETIKKNLNQ